MGQTHHLHEIIATKFAGSNRLDQRGYLVGYLVACLVAFDFAIQAPFEDALKIPTSLDVW